MLPALRRCSSGWPSKWWTSSCLSCERERQRVSSLYERAEASGGRRASAPSPGRRGRLLCAWRRSRQAASSQIGKKCQRGVSAPARASPSRRKASSASEERRRTHRRRPRVGLAVVVVVAGLRRVLLLRAKPADVRRTEQFSETRSRARWAGEEEGGTHSGGGSLGRVLGVRHDGVRVLLSVGCARKLSMTRERGRRRRERSGSGREGS